MGRVELVCIILAACGIAVAQDSDLFELNIVHYNDFHAHFDEVSPNGGLCNPDAESCIGGFARLYTAIQEALEVEPDSLVLNGGDTFQGTIWYNLLRWRPAYTFMNMIPHTAHVLGNHEFDHGPEGLLPYLMRLVSPMLGANVNTTFEPELSPYIRNHIVVERRGRRIGIIGVLLQSFSAPIGGVIVEDELEAVNREAAILTEQGVDIIILLSHVGFDSDVRLASQVSPTIDFIVGAHSHTLLYTGETPDGSTPAANYPHIVTRPDGHTIPIVQASAYTRYLGNIKLFFDAAGKLQKWEGEPLYLGSSIVQDPHIMFLLAPWRDQVDALGKEVLGKSLVTLNRSWCSRGECNMGNWACDALLDEMMQLPREQFEVSPTSWNVAHVSLVNAGGLRTQINPGEITTEGLLMAVPFENTVQIYDLKGEYLLEALEFSVGTAQNDPSSFQSGRMLQIGGMRNVYNVSKPAGSRVVSALVRCIECDIPVYEPLDVNKTYRVVSQNYIGDGGSGFTVLSEKRENKVDLDLDYVMLQRYMRRQQVVMQDLDGRIQIVY
ncbi:calcineurin-like phosphoesterase domain-containing protein [Phthorimaea operculella]|nr:calcineurin-like phosphoesterase domain-containing protein [Phthorimaea operculella]